MPETTVLQQAKAVLQQAKDIDQHVAKLLDNLTNKESNTVIGINDLEVIHEVLGDIVSKIGTITEEVNKRESVKLRASAQRHGYTLVKVTKKPKVTFTRKMLRWDVLPTGEANSVNLDELYSNYNKSTKVRGAKLTKSKFRDKIQNEVEKNKIGEIGGRYFYKKRGRKKSNA